MPELAKAYVQIIPSAEGIKGNLTSIMDSEAETAGQSSGNKFASSFGSVVKVGLAAVGALAGATLAAGTAFVSGVNSVAEYGDNIDKMSQKMGLSIEAYQEWDAVMRHSGTSIDSMQSSMRTLANAVESGNDAFERIGLSMEDIQGMSNEDLFSATITALQNVDNETERTYLAGQLLGRGATELGALLNTSAEETQAMKDRVHELGGVLSEDAVAASAGFKDSLQDMQTAFGGVKNALLTNFLPGMSTVMDGLAAIFSGQDGGVEMVSAGMEEVIARLNESMPQFLEAAGGILSSLITVLGENLGPATTMAIDLLMQLGNAVISALPEIVSALTSEGIPALLTGAIGLVVSLLSHLDQIIVPIISSIPVVFQAVATSMSQAIPTLTAAMPVVTQSILSAITEATPLMIQTGVMFLESLISDLPLIIETVCSAIPDIVLALVDLTIQSAPLIIEAGVQLLCSLISNLPLIISTILTSIPQIIESICSGLVERWPDIQQAGVELFECLVTNIDQAVSSVLTALGSLLTEIYNGVVAGVSDMLSAGGQLVAGIWNGISNSLQWIKTKISGWVGDVLGFVKNLFGIASPSKVFAGFGMNLAQGLGVGIENGIGVVEDAIGDMSDAAVNAWTADQLSTNLTGSAAYQFSGPNGAVTGGEVEQSEILNAIFAVGNMIVSAVNAIDPDIQLDGASLADKLYHYNLEAANRYGAAMVT